MNARDVVEGVLFWLVAWWSLFIFVVSALRELGPPEATGHVRQDEQVRTVQRHVTHFTADCALVRPLWKETPKAALAPPPPVPPLLMIFFIRDALRPVTTVDWIIFRPV